jgi:hypothetical protein
VLLEFECEVFSQLRLNPILFLNGTIVAVFVEVDLGMFKGCVLPFRGSIKHVRAIVSDMNEIT